MFVTITDILKFQPTNPNISYWR